MKYFLAPLFFSKSVLWQGELLGEEHPAFCSKISKNLTGILARTALFYVTVGRQQKSGVFSDSSYLGRIITTF